MSKRFNQAFDKLVAAFFNETLSKGDCDRCAVGNIVGNNKWSDVFLSTNGKQFHKYLKYPYSNIVQRGIDAILATGYSVEEMARIEFAFEQNTNYQSTELIYGKITRDEFIQDQFNGLCAVVELLCEFEGITDAQYYKNILGEKAEVE
mgnify:CR=1 FL=1|jgi:hypothetical protein